MMTDDEKQAVIRDALTRPLSTWGNYCDAAVELSGDYVVWGLGAPASVAIAQHGMLPEDYVLAMQEFDEEELGRRGLYWSGSSCGSPEPECSAEHEPDYTAPCPRLLNALWTIEDRGAVTTTTNNDQEVN